MINFQSISREYSIAQLTGFGSFGTVVQATCKETNRNVAIKRIPNIHRTRIDTKRILRELDLLNNLRHRNIISLQHVKVVKNDIFFVTEYCDLSLSTILSIKEVRISILTNARNVIYILFQILAAVKFMHSVEILHRDIKPANVLLNANMCVKICDFGLSRRVKDCSAITERDDEPLTEYMVTRWYRAPEVLLNPGRYGKANDIWSVACTFAELIILRPLFPGTDTVGQIRIILESIGGLTQRDKNFDMTPGSKRFLNNYNGKTNDVNNFYMLLNDSHSIDPLLLSLLLEMLQFNPHHRITAEDALQWGIFDSKNSHEDNNLSNIVWDRHELCLQQIRESETPEERLAIIKQEVQRVSKEIKMKHSALTTYPEPSHSAYFSTRDEKTVIMKPRSKRVISVMMTALKSLTTTSWRSILRPKTVFNHTYGTVFPGDDNQKAAAYIQPEICCGVNPVGNHVDNSCSYKVYSFERCSSTGSNLGDHTIFEPESELPKPIHSWNINTQNPYRTVKN